MLDIVRYLLIYMYYIKKCWHMYLVTFFFFLKRLFVLLALDLKKKNVMSRTGLESKPKPTTLFWV